MLTSYSNHLGTAYPVSMKTCLGECSLFNEGLFNHGQDGANEKCAGINFVRYRLDCLYDSVNDIEEYLSMTRLAT